MKFYKVLVFFVLIFIWSCDKNEQKDQNLILNPRIYVLNPSDLDHTCKYEIKRAIDSIQDGNIKFVQLMGMLFGDIRYENELIDACSEYGISYEIEMLGCLIEENQSQGCYGAVMDNELEKIHGPNFKQYLRNVADSVFLEKILKNKTFVEYYNCDTRPRQPKERQRNSDGIPSIIVPSIPLKFSQRKYDGSPFMDIEFKINLDSTIFDFKLNNYVSVLDENLKFEDELFEKAVKNIQRWHSKWVPGIIREQYVYTINNVRISFVEDTF